MTHALRSTSKAIHKKTLSNYARIIQKLYYLRLNYAVTVSTKKLIHARLVFVTRNFQFNHEVHIHFYVRSSGGKR